MTPILHLSLYSHPTATMRMSFYKMTENMEQGSIISAEATQTNYPASNLPPQL